ncbi:hypothetical protein KIW84_025219 [Lathyrus oleraceus]|uniref:Uncharacterized protein n=1 Tax=Pisum sativum TaxID=3888 RepID=A0A9D4YIL2_PEA|nr:hypothetical protein KIW84_025219 [Pisum sativum]
MMQALDAGWIVEHPRRATQAKKVPNTEERPTETSGPRRPQLQHLHLGVPLIDEDSQAHMDQMRRYLTHQVDTWAASQRLRDRFYGDPPSMFYGHYQWPGMETPIQLGGPIQQHRYHHMTPFSLPILQQHQSPFRSSEQRPVGLDVPYLRLYASW